MMRIVARAVAICFLPLFFLASLLANPARAFFFGGVTIKDEKELGRKFDTLTRSNLPIIDDPEVTNYVNSVLKRLLKNIPRQPFEFKASVIDHTSLNAFAVPGGYVYVFSGLIMNLESEAELAGVMAHELAHVTQRHVAARMERAQYLTLGALLIAAAGVALGGVSGGAAAIGAVGASQSAMLNYSRADENEADNIGLQYLLKAGYNPDGMTQGFKVLRQKSWMSGVSVPTYLSTHPAIGDRVNSMSARVAALPKKAYAKDDSRFKRVKTLLWARRGDPKVAERRFSASDPLSLMGKGIALSRQNRVKDAENVFAKAVAAAPNDPLILREAGVFHFRKGDKRKAEKYLTDAMRLDRDDFMATFYYGRLLDETGRAAEAPAYYRETLRRAPRQPDVHEAMARSLGASGDRFLAYVHMAYAAIYGNDKKQAERYLKEARSLGEKARDRTPLRRLETEYKERKEIWDKS